MLAESNDFYAAYQRALALVGASAWAALSPEQQTDAIFREIRLIETERAAHKKNDC